jgi:hypothetical protein
MVKWVLLVCFIFLGCSLLDDEKFCEVEQEKYEVKESFSIDCNTCICNEDGTTICTEMACIDDEPPRDSIDNDGVYCEFEGAKYRVDDSIYDGCNHCFCQEDGFLLCTLTVCEELDL